MKDKFSAEVWWGMVQTLDHAATYIQEDAGLRDVVWTKDLNDASNLLQDKANKLRAKCVKFEEKI